MLPKWTDKICRSITKKEIEGYLKKETDDYFKKRTRFDKYSVFENIANVIHNINHTLKPLLVTVYLLGRLVVYIGFILFFLRLLFGF